MIKQAILRATFSLLLTLVGSIFVLYAIGDYFTHVEGVLICLGIGLISMGYTLAISPMYKKKKN